MNDLISKYQGINPTPSVEVRWQDVLHEISSGKLRAIIDKAREIKEHQGPNEYREFKKKLPSVTFSGLFNGSRSNAKIKLSTGFIVSDLDHLSNVEATFKRLKEDSNIWFLFRSPSGDGIKCGLRTDGIQSDTDHKRFYAAIEKYFKQVHNLQIDPACKDISRLTFLSHDHDSWVNNSPSKFDVNSWINTSQADSQTSQDYAQPSGKEKYALKVLESCCEAIRTSEPGSQHIVRRDQARLIGGYLHYLDESFCMSMLERAVVDSGAKDLKSSMKTISDGLAHGKANPIYIPELNSPLVNPQKLTQLTQVTNTHTTHANSQKLTQTHTFEKRFEGNLTGSIREYVLDNVGSFTNEKIDREFGIVHPKDKNIRRRTLTDLKKEKYIRIDDRVAGTWHIIKKNIEYIDLNNIDESSFNIELPLSLSQLVRIPPKSIIVIAGAGNAGKTTLALNIVQANLSKNYPIHYFMSEMGASEYKGKVMNLSCGINAWSRKVKAAAITDGYGDFIETENPDGLNVVDFLEEKDGEYYKITSHIRKIYDALNTGIAIICLQKHSRAEVGRGGEGTAEKARLYLTIDNIGQTDFSAISAIRIYKAKDYPGKNPNGQARHIIFEDKGATITPITEWEFCPHGKLQQWKEHYQGMTERGQKIKPTCQPENPGYWITLKDGKSQITYEQACMWDKAFDKINVHGELRWMQESSKEKPYYTKNNYFGGICGLFGKKNKERGGT